MTWKNEQPGFEPTADQMKAMDVLTARAMHCALGGGARCVAGDTVLDGQTLTIQELAWIGKPVRVRTTHGYQMAEAPFRKGQTQLHRVTLQSGRSITVTDDHRFWNGLTWVKTSQLSVGDQLSVRSLRVSSLDDALSVFRVGGRRLMQILAGWMDRCFGHSRQCDQPPHRPGVGGQGYRASSSGGPEHNLLDRLVSQLRESGNRTVHPLVRAEVGTLTDLQSYRPSRPDALWDQDSAFGSPALAYGQTSEWFPSLYPVDRLSGWLSGLSKYIQERIADLLFYLSENLCVSPSDIPLSTGYVLDKVSSITRTARQNYYTLHVPGTEQYFANGILHHNSGKTFWIIRALIIRSQLAPGARQAIFRFRQNSLVASVVEDTFPKVMELCFPKNFYRPDIGWHKTPNLFYEFANKSQIWFAGLDDKERVEKVLGQEFSGMYFNECSQIPWGSVTLAKTRLAQKVMTVAGDNAPERPLAIKCYYDFNPPSKRHWTYQQFVEKKDPETRKPVDDEFNISYMLMNPEGNKANLSSEYIKLLEDLAPKARRRFLLGQFADDSDGSLWTEELLDQQRIGVKQVIPNLVRIIVAVDPSGCSGEEDFRSDEVGIVVVGLGADGHAYLLEDLSGRYGPRDWARIVNSAFNRHEADKVVCEQNYGGAMVQSTLEAENPLLPIGLVHASRGKIVRAEPISQLYERGLVHHVGHFPEIEDQLVSFTTSGYQGMHSPDRADAVVWAVTELFPGITQKDRNKPWTPPSVVTRPRSASAYNRTKRYATRRRAAR